MKKILIIAFLMLSTICFAQSTQKDLSPVGVSVLHPTTYKIVLQTKSPKGFVKKLDSLSNVYKVDKFILQQHYADGITKQCVIQKRIPKDNCKRI